MDVISFVAIILLIALLPHFIIGWAASSKMRSFGGWTFLSFIICNLSGFLEYVFGTWGIFTLIIFIALLIMALQPSDAYRRKEIFEEEKLRANMREEQERLKERIMLHSFTIPQEKPLMIYTENDNEERKYTLGHYSYRLINRHYFPLSTIFQQEWKFIIKGSNNFTFKVSFR